MMDRIGHRFLPAEILRVYVHGSYLRGDDLPGDLDVVILARVKDEWPQWHEAFSSLRECHDILWEYYEKGTSLEEVVQGPMAPEIRKRGIPMEWVTTMSWSELWGHSTLYMPYMLFWDRVTKRILTKGMKGVHIQLETSNSMFTSVAGRLHKYHDIPVFLIWSAELSALCELEPAINEYETYLRLENEKLQTDMAYYRFLTVVGKFLIEKSLPFVPKEKLGDVAIQALCNTPRYEASEETLRDSLRKFGIPEDKVFAIKQRGTKTWYRLARTEGEEIELKNHVKTLEEMNKAGSMIQELLRKVVSKDEATKVDCWVLDIEKGRVAVQIMKPANMDQSHFRTLWESRGFKVEDVWGRVYGRKEAILHIGAGRQEIAEEIAKILGGPMKCS